MGNQHIWIRLVRAAERMSTYTPGGVAFEMSRKNILRDLEEVCPDAFRVLVKQEV